MDAFTIRGNLKLKGEVAIAGAKNVALKTFVASLLTDDEITIRNIPHIKDVLLMLDVMKHLGVETQFKDHVVHIKKGALHETTVPLDVGGRLRTSSMVIGPLLARYGQAKIPNPGGCRIGARPIERHIEGLKLMGAQISYDSGDGYFHAKATKLHGVHYTFPKNTHTGTETLLLASVLADGETVLDNAAEEIEIDDLIAFLSSMGAKIKRMSPRTIVIEGVSSLHGTEHTIMPDRNEEVTFAVASAITHGSIVTRNSRPECLKAFHEAFCSVGGSVELLDKDATRYSVKDSINALDIITAPYPGFMTDWQGPWAVLMTQGKGISTIHETVFESRFSYVSELKKMGATIEFYDPDVKDPETFYNFNWEDRIDGYHQGIRITGPTALHNAILAIDDLRAGATLVLAALAAEDETLIHGVEHIDRGYENIEIRLGELGADIKRVKE